VPTAPTPAIARLQQAGIAHRVRAYELPERHGRERDERPDYGLEAAAALGIEPARMGKTLIVSVDGDALVAAVVPVDRQLDVRALASAVGARRAVLADPFVAERATGAVVGGISPLGMRRRLPVVIDASLLDHDTVHVSAGRRGLQIELAPADLVAVTGALVSRIWKSG
jgi:Cys-tRNA(Pro)/Cys-tRNA(Cys) deacylase